MEANKMARTGLRNRNQADENTAPEGTEPEGTTPENTAPEGTEGNAPEGTTPEGTAPEGTEGTEGNAPEAAPATDELSLDFLSEGGVILAEALTAETMPVRARNERQQVLDRKVKAAHDNWTAKGKPGDWNGQVKAGVVVTYFPAPDKAAELKKLINKAADPQGVRIRYGSSFVVTDQHIQRFNLKPELLGHEAVSFAVLDKKPRTVPATTTTTTTAPEGTEGTTPEGTTPEADNS